jgi:hypothetical protein
VAWLTLGLTEVKTVLDWQAEGFGRFVVYRSEAVEGVIVYDPRTESVHYLSQLPATVEKLALYIQSELYRRGAHLDLKLQFMKAEEWALLFGEPQVLITHSRNTVFAHMQDLPLAIAVYVDRECDIAPWRKTYLVFTEAACWNKFEEAVKEKSQASDPVAKQYWQNVLAQLIGSRDAAMIYTVYRGYGMHEGWLNVMFGPADYGDPTNYGSCYCEACNWSMNFLFYYNDLGDEMRAHHEAWLRHKEVHPDCDGMNE